MNITRYDLEGSRGMGRTLPIARIKTDGPYVLHSDHLTHVQQLEAEARKLREALGEAVLFFEENGGDKSYAWLPDMRVLASKEGGSQCACTALPECISALEAVSRLAMIEEYSAIHGMVKSALAKAALASKEGGGK